MSVQYSISDGASIEFYLPNSPMITVIPSGVPTGATGPAGATGATGATGPQGPQGPAGPSTGIHSFLLMGA